MYYFQIIRVSETLRYLSVLYIMYSVSIAFLVGETLSYAEPKKQVKLLSAVMAFAVIIVFVFNYKIFVKAYTKDKENYRTVEENYTRESASQIKDEISADDRVLIIDCTCDGYPPTSLIKYSYAYEMIPYYSMAMLLDDDYAYGNYTTEDLNQMVLDNLFDKVVILNPDDDFESKFGSQFEKASNMDIFSVEYNIGKTIYKKIY